MMNTAIIKVLSGKQNIEEETLTLIVEFAFGQVVEGDFVFLKEAFFSATPYLIKSIRNSSERNAQELIVHFPEMDWMWNDRLLKHIKEEDNTAFCGISIATYSSWNMDDKIAYFLKIAGLIGDSKANQYINSHLRIADTLVFSEVGDSLKISKFGGLPVAHKEFQFPKDEHGLSAIFIGQINVKEFTHLSKAIKQDNREGILYFFSTIQQANGYNSYKDIIIKYSHLVEDVNHVSLPDDLLTHGTLPELGIVAAESIAIPPCESSLWVGEKMTTEERNAYWYIETILLWYKNNYGITLLGYPHQVQGCVLLETELKNKKLLWYNPGYDSNNDTLKTQTLNNAAQTCIDWKLLFEFDGAAFSELSNSNGVFNEYMDGTYYVMIRQHDLEKMNFENIETIYQCT